MKKLLVTAGAISFGVLAGIAAACAADVPMPWAYGSLTPPASQPGGAPAPAPNPPAPPDNVTKLTLPGSTLSFTRAQLADRYGPAELVPAGAQPDAADHRARPAIGESPPSSHAAYATRRTARDARKTRAWRACRMTTSCSN